MVINRAHQFFLGGGLGGMYMYMLYNFPIHPEKKTPQEKLCFIKR